MALSTSAIALDIKIRDPKMLPENILERRIRGLELVKTKISPLVSAMAVFRGIKILDL